MRGKAVMVDILQALGHGASYAKHEIYVLTLYLLCIEYYTG